MMYRLFGAIALGIMLSACSNDNITVNISNDVISAGYIGNGAEWDPYDEAESWGCEISDADWEKIQRRLDFMRPGFIRCMINSPYTYYDNGKYERERHSANILKLLSYCQDNGIHVVFGEFNPPLRTMKDDPEWVKMSVDYLNWLVNVKGFTCIKEFVIFNEPDGNWASTNGDYGLWLKMAKQFTEEMGLYPDLSQKVKLAGPDVVAGYRNEASAYDCEGWVERSSVDIDEEIGLYDVHAYPGQASVRSGEFASVLRSIKGKVPYSKKIVLGEAGYKYFSDPADSLLSKEYWKRVRNCPFTKGSDCNMLCGDYFYGIDLSLLAMEVMNCGYSGLALWMLDDAMHSNGDSGKTEDVKIWGLWNILGEEVFNDPELEKVKIPYYTWSLMCRYFPQGCNILRTEGNGSGEWRTCAAEKNGKKTFAAVNYSKEDICLDLNLSDDFKEAKMYLYQENNLKWDGEFPAPVREGIRGRRCRVEVPADSFVLITEMN